MQTSTRINQCLDVFGCRAFGLGSNSSGSIFCNAYVPRKYRRERSRCGPLAPHAHGWDCCRNLISLPAPCSAHACEPTCNQHASCMSAHRVFAHAAASHSEFSYMRVQLHHELSRKVKALSGRLVVDGDPAVHGDSTASNFVHSLTSKALCRICLVVGLTTGKALCHGHDTHWHSPAAAKP